MKIKTFDQRFIFFWMGLLTGALAVAVIFTYQLIEKGTLENAVLRNIKTQQSTTLTSPDMVTEPDMLTSPDM